MFSGTILSSGIYTFTIRANGDAGTFSDSVLTINISPNYLQRGTDIYSNTIANCRNGSSVSLNYDGSIVAIGSPGSNNENGSVQVYKWNSLTKFWEAYGQNIISTATSSNSGRSVSLNSNGNILAIGADTYNVDTGSVNVYTYNTTTNQWVLRGNTLIGDVGDRFGQSVALNSTGNTIAIGAPFSNGITSGYRRGKVRIYDWNGTQWLIRGSGINGFKDSDYMGRDIAINLAGTIVAMGARTDGTDNTASGYARVIKWNATTQVWENYGNTIYSTPEDRNGWAVSLDDTGNIIAVGSPFNDESGMVNSGCTRVYTYNSGTSLWVQRGANIYGQTTDERSGYDVRLSSDGNIVAITANINDEYGNNAGATRIFKWNNNSWSQIGETIYGYTENQQSGRSIALGNNGSILAIGSPFYTPSEELPNVGYVSVYNYV